VFVVELAGVQAVVELAEEFVEQVSLGLAVPVSCGAAGIEVSSGAGRGAQRRQRPDRADGGQAPVFDMPMQHNSFLAAGAGDRRRTGESFQPAGVSEAGAVVANLGQYPGAGQLPQAGKAGDDRGVRVLLKMGDRRLGQLIGGCTSGIELAQQCGQLDAHRVFDRGWLVQVGVGEHLAQPLDVAVKVAAAAGFDQQPAQPRRGQLGGLRGGGRGGQDGAGIGSGQPAAGQLGECYKGGIPGKNRYRLTGDGLRFAIFYTKLHDRLLRPLLATDRPPAPPPLRKALHTIDIHIAETIDRARLLPNAA
jgi:hypothetical protein